MMRWCDSNRFDPVAAGIADRHYNRRAVGTNQFVPPGRCVVLVEEMARAFWVTSWPLPQYTKHRWAGAWVCSAFRSEEAGGSIELVRQALAATRHVFGEPPDMGLVTFIDCRKVEPIMVRGLPTFGWVWRKAGFHYVGKTEGGLLAFQIKPDDMPAAMAPQQRLPQGLPLFDEAFA
jgi:hypothetical protein